MKVHSPQFKENIKTLGRELDAKIIYGEEELTTEELNRVSIRYSSEFFRTIMKEVEFETSTKITAKQWINVQAGIKVDGEYEYIDYGNYYIIKEPEYNADIEGYTYIAYDKMIESMVFYDDNPLVIEYPVSYKDYIIQICNKLNWDYNLPVEFPNMNTEIKEDLYVGLGLTYRDILDDICPVSMGSFINDGTFKIIYPNETGDTIDDEFLKADNVVIGNKIGPVNALVLSRVEDADTINRRDEESIEENGINEIKIKDNILLSSSFRENFIDEMFNKIKGFEYYAIDVATTGIMYYEPLDKFTINHDSINYPTIILNSELNIDDGIEELLYSPELEESVTNYETSSQTDKAKKMATIVAYKNKAEIELLAYELTDLTEYINTITSINSLHLTNTVESTGAINKLEITGFTQQVLYPGMQYPSEYTYPGVLTQYTIISSPTATIDENAEKYTLIAQSPLLSGDTLKIENGKVTIVRAGGSVETYGNMYIKTFSGDTYITVEYFDDITLTCEYLKENPYTTQFATMQEVEGQIKIAKDEIDLTVSEKVGENEIISKINLSPEEIKILSSKLNISATDILNLIAGNEINLTSKNITIASDKFNVDAYGNLECESATVNSATINGSAIVNGDKFSVDSEGNMTCNGATLTGGTITSQKFKVDAEGNIEASGGTLGGYTINSNSLSSDIYSPYTFTQTDFNKLGDYMRGTGTLTNAEKELYDLNKDGILDSTDLLLMRRYIIVGITPQNPGKIKIDNSDVFNNITIEDGNGNKKIDINAFMTVIDHASINNLTVSKLSARNIMYGSIDMTPSQANVPVIASVIFSPAYDLPPCVFACANTLVPGTKVKEVSVANVMTDSFDIVLTRSNTNTTTVYYFAIGD